jgi:hypothetical protein
VLVASPGGQHHNSVHSVCGRLVKSVSGTTLNGLLSRTVAHTPERPSKPPCAGLTAAHQSVTGHEDRAVC